MQLLFSVTLLLSLFDILNMQLYCCFILIVILYATRIKRLFAKVKG